MRPAFANSAQEAPPPDSEPIEVWEPSEEAAALSADSFPDSFRRAPPVQEVPAAPITLLAEEDGAAHDDLRPGCDYRS